MSDPTIMTPDQVWRAEAGTTETRLLYEKAKLAQWNASEDIDWTIPVRFGATLPDDSAFGLRAFEASPLARFGRGKWDEFRWELQAWMISQFLHGEHGALVATARLAEVLPDMDAKYCASIQVADEARHVEAFARYLDENVPYPYPPSPGLLSLLDEILTDRRWDVTALGMQIFVEALALGAFRIADRTFHDDLIKQISRLVARDEARHVSFGILVLTPVMAALSDSERSEREELVLECASAMSRRFLLEDIWERMGVDRHEGIAFATRDPMMIAYRRIIFTKVVSALDRIGLMADPVRRAFYDLDLLAVGNTRASSRATE